MTALIIVGAVLLLLFAIGMTRIKFRFAYTDGIVAVAQVLFIKLRLYPKKKKKHKTGDYEIKRFRKRVGKNISRSDRKAKKNRLKAEKKKNKKQKKKTDEAGEEQGTAKKRAIKPLVRMLIRILKVFVRKFPRYLQVNVSRLVIGVATDDAADTAITYGYVVQSVQYALTYIKLNSNLKQSRKAVVSVYPDFTVSKPIIELDFTLSIRIWQVLALGIALIIAYLSKGSENSKS